MQTKHILSSRSALLPVMLAASLLAACTGKGDQQAASTDSTYTPATLTSAEESSPVAFENVWVKLGDSEGGIDCECGIASIESAEFSPDGKYIVSGSKKGRDVIMWETETGNRKWEKKLAEEIEAVAFSRDGRYVAIGGEDKSIHILNAGDGREVKLLKLTAPIDGMRFSNKGDLLVGGDEAGLIHVWRTSDRKETHTARQGDDEAAGGPKGKHADINSIDFTSDDQYMSTAGRNSVVKLWKVSDMSLVRTLEGHTGSVKSARISPDGKLVASASADPDTLKGDNSVRVWDFTGRQLAHFKHPKGMEAVEFSPSGKFLLAGGRQGGGYDVKATTNGFVYAYAIPANPQTEEIKLVNKLPVFRSEYLHFTQDGKRLVTSHEDGTLRLWNVKGPGVRPR